MGCSQPSRLAPERAPRVEKCADIKIEHPANALRHQRLVQARQRFMRAAAWSEAIAEPVEVGLVDRIQDFGDRALDDLVLQGWDDDFILLEPLTPSGLCS